MTVNMWIAIAERIGTGDWDELPPTAYLCWDLFSDYFCLIGIDWDALEVSEETLNNPPDDFRLDDFTLTGWCEVEHKVSDVLPVEVWSRDNNDKASYEAYQKALLELQDSDEYAEALAYEEAHLGDSYGDYINQ